MTRKVLIKADIVEAVNARMGLPKSTSAQVVDDLLDIVKERLAAGEPVKISGFGAFDVRKKAARRGRNPQTGQSLTIEPRTVLTFKPSPKLKKAINRES
jgi:integration host factor subunit alpha